MIDNLFTAALALALLVGGTVAIASTLGDRSASPACAARATIAAPR